MFSGGLVIMLKSPTTATGETLAAIINLTMENNKHIPINAKCTFEEIEAVDLIDAIKSLPFFKSNSFFIPTNMTIASPGDGVDYLIDWSMNDIYEAITQNEQGKDFKQNATNAVINARRSLACLVDWYLQRDGFSYCKNAPRNAEEKSKILLGRRIIDKLTSKVLQRIIDIRNETEHQYKSVSIEKAEDIVELVRRAKDSLFLNSNPAQASIIFGEFKHRYSYNGPTKYPTYEFHGWESEAFIIALYEIDPWIGVLVPESINKASIRRAFLKTTKVEVLTQILNILYASRGYYSDSSGLKYRPRWSGYPKTDLLRLVKLAGLVN